MSKRTARPPVEERGQRLLRSAENLPRLKTSRLGRALVEAIRYQDSELALWLLKHGADANARDNKRRSALWWAATRCLPAVIRELVKRGAALPDDVLMGPVTSGDAGTVRFLIQCGANVNCVASTYTGIGRLHTKETPLAAALRTTAVHPELERVSIMLIRAGAEVNQVIRDSRSMLACGLSLLGLAAHYGMLKTVKAMLAAGADANRRDQKGRTALFDALEQGQLPVVRELLRAGAKTNLRDRVGRTPLESIQQQERSPQMTGTEWLTSTGVAADPARQESEARAWHQLHSRMIALLERHARTCQ